MKLAKTASRRVINVFNEAAVAGNWGSRTWEGDSEYGGGGGVILGRKEDGGCVRHSCC